MAPKGLIWSLRKSGDLKIYLTFDDGPHPEITPFVLEQLDKYQAKASFFCIGKNVKLYPEIVQQTKTAGHCIGNHTYNHLNGWKTPDSEYIKNVASTAELIPSNAFRPPYGRITKAQSRILQAQTEGYNIYMWTVLSADFDEGISPEKCLRNVIKHIKPGAIVVFHDSTKAWARLKYALPRVLEYCKEKGWKMEKLNM